ncbi:MAG: Do family serine endopeptidase [Spirochaetales bacterium]|nr:Do family serine endopeptidase [Spirochaetales bacterium]
MEKKKSIFTSQKFLIFNIALVSVILGFTVSTLLIWGVSGNNRFPNAFAQDSDTLEKGYQALENIQYSFRNVANVALPVVVELNVVEVVKGNSQGATPWEYFFSPPGERNDQDEDFEYRRPGLGSGVIVKRDGNKVFVITNNHVVGKASEISVLLNDGRNYPGKIVAKDERTDLALISFETSQDVPLAKLGDSDNTEVGDWAIAIGNPFGFESTLTVGVISAVGRSALPGSGIANFNQYIQTDADINPGNSGGALLNVRGEVIGINTWIASQSGASAGVGFAIPINNVKKVMNDFLTKGSVEYGWLGVGIDDPSAEAYPGAADDLGIKDKPGALVISLFKGSPAEKDGILPGDYIVKVDGKAVKNATHLTQIVGNLPPNRAVEFVLIREKKEITRRVTLVARESEEKVRSNKNVWPGFTAARLTDDIRKRLKAPHTIAGMFVSGVTAGTSAESAGLKAGDIIMKVNNKVVGNVLDFYKALNDRSQDEVSFRVWREDKEFILGIVH